MQRDVWKGGVERACKGRGVQKGVYRGECAKRMGVKKEVCNGGGGG